MEITSQTFWRTVVVAVVATFTMSLTGFWQSGIGLAALDPAAMLAASMTAAHPEQPYGLLAGNLAHYANGVVLALAFVAFLQARIPGGWAVQGLVYAVLTTTLAAGVVVPIAAGAGVFFANTPAPALMTLSSFVAAPGIRRAAETLGLRLAGVRQAAVVRAQEGHSLAAA